MKKKEVEILEGFFVGFFVGLVAAWIYEENKKHQNRINQLNKSLNQGHLLDKENIDNDWYSIANDVRYSYNELLKTTDK
jgi:hypothetical protein